VGEGVGHHLAEPLRLDALLLGPIQKLEAQHLAVLLPETGGRDATQGGQGQPFQ
jgi:hypothetical protein